MFALRAEFEVRGRIKPSLSKTSTCRDDDLANTSYETDRWRDES